MAKQRPNREAFWNLLISRFQSSNLTVREFCSQEKVSEQAFYAWKRKLKQATESNGNRQAQHRSLHSPSPTTSAFVPVQVTDVAIELNHPRGYQLRIPESFDPHALSQLLDVLDQRGL